MAQPVGPAAAQPRAQSLVPFAAVSAAYFAHIGFFNPYLPLWLKSLGQPLWAIGVLTSVQSITRIFMPYVWGWLGDHTGRPVLCMRIGACAALAGACALWAYSAVTAPTFWGLFLGLLLLFTPTSAIIPTSEALLTQRMTATGSAGFDAHRYGRLRLWGSLGFLLTVLGAGSLFDAFGLGVFLPLAALTLVAVVGSVFLLQGESTAHKPAAAAGGNMLAELAKPANRWLFGSVFLHVLAHVSIYVFFSLWLHANGHSKAVIGAMWALGVAVEIAVLYWQGPWLARLSWAHWLVVCALACALRMGLIAAGASVLLVVALAQCLHGITFATHHTAVIALIAERAPAGMSGRFQAIYAVTYGLAGVVGGFGGGWVSERAGLGWVFGIAAGVAVAAAFAARQLLKDSR